MNCWIFAHDPLEHYLDQYRETFAAWEDGGVRGLVVGRLYFRGDGGALVPAVPLDPKAYARLGQPAPAPQPRDEAKERRLSAMLDDARARGWHVMVFDSGAPAYVQSLVNRYPQVHGVIVDGPGENHYELPFHHGGELFEIRPHEQQDFADLGLDLDRLHRGIDHLCRRFHSLTPDLVRYHADGGILAGLLLFDIDEDTLYWLRARQARSRNLWQSYRADLDQVDRYVELGGIPRITSFSSLTGQNYQQMPAYFDYIFPKHYYWHRGFDGMYGTVARWVQQLLEWNPSLCEADGFALVRSLFGLELPGVSSLLDLEMGFSEAFFAEVVYQETRRALAAIGDPDKAIFWVSTGRRPHDGDPMGARDLAGILQATEQAGGRRFLFHPDPHPSAGEWSVLSAHCGNPWRQSVDGYWPPDSTRPDTWRRPR
jgi:hypothetical protein